MIRCRRAFAALALLGVAAGVTATRKQLVAAIHANAQKDYPGLTDEPRFKTILAAIATIDRAAFVPPEQRANAYRDAPLPIGYAQTISDAYIVAIMTDGVAVGPGSNVLEIGTGSGYQAAVLSRLGASTHTVEIVPELAKSAAKRLKRFGFGKIWGRTGDGFAGWREAGPYDGIIVTAGAARVPQPLLDQLKPGGKLVMPIGANAFMEQLVVYAKKADGTLTRCSLGPASFVPLTGQGETGERQALYDRSIPLCRRGQRAHWPGQPDG